MQDTHGEQRVSWRRSEGAGTFVRTSSVVALLLCYSAVRVASQPRKPIHPLTRSPCESTPIYQQHTSGYLPLPHTFIHPLPFLTCAHRLPTPRSNPRPPLTHTNSSAAR